MSAGRKWQSVDAQCQIHLLFTGVLLVSPALDKGSGCEATEAAVQRLTMLVTPQGRWVLPDSAEFPAALGDPDPDYDAEAFAVKNLGFIKFRVIERSIIEIELHPRNVKLPALLAVQQQLLSSRIRLF